MRVGFDPSQALDKRTELGLVRDGRISMGDGGGVDDRGRRLTVRKEAVEDRGELLDGLKVHLEVVTVLAGDPMAFAHLRHLEGELGDSMQLPGRGLDAHVRIPRNIAAVAAAAVGVLLLTHARALGDPLGVAFAFANAALFALYIILAHRVSRRSAVGDIDGLAAAMLFALIFVTPIGFLGAARAFGAPIAIAAGIGVGVSSSVIPYVLDQLAMARLPRSTYALFLALLPATATIMGVIVLRQIPSVADLIGIALVMFGVGVHKGDGQRSSAARAARTASSAATAARSATVASSAAVRASADSRSA